ncbi:hypothetical protein PGT21_008985 [Puccinia graminis f. sp. tritici]|uniref:Uncharacterized protein n=1 Tax=Puccinia graminis f. sp. tritici TaxID=56615 RepID=A0A5B0Q5W2_PUCGR|nr:hypothetical protein PGT21_008985 [Puccinia graminis f. sp. tritici]
MFFGGGGFDHPGMQFGGSPTVFQFGGGGWTNFQRAASTVASLLPIILFFIVSLIQSFPSLFSSRELVDAFRQHDKLERLAWAKRELLEAKKRSRTKVRGSLRPTNLLQTGDSPVAGGSYSSSSHSHSPSLNLSAAPEPCPVSHPPRDPSPPSTG